MTIAAFCFCGCSKSQEHMQLSSIETMLTIDTGDVFDPLNPINYDILSNAKKHYYLTVKIIDKNYFEHSSDSLIMEVVRCEPLHENNDNPSHALNQQDVYNYQTHEYERERTEKKSKSLENTVMWLLLLLVVLISIIIILYFRNRYATRIIKLQQALANLNELKTGIEQINSLDIHKQTSSTDSTDNGDFTSNNSITHSNRRIIPKKKELRKRLQDELLQLYENSTDDAMIANEILQSDIYKQFKESADNGRIVIDSDSRWLDLEQVVLATSPQFINNLYLLASGKLTVAEIHTALLIKCGFRPVDMTILLGKSNGAIITRRNSICMKVLDKKMEAKVITNIIRLL